MPGHAAIQEVAYLDVLEGKVVPRELAPETALERINVFVSQLCIGKQFETHRDHSPSPRAWGSPFKIGSVCACGIVGLHSARPERKRPVRWFVLNTMGNVQG
jgi:hypothetical protein